MNPFQIMSEPVRRRIVEVLASGEHSSGEICNAIAAEFCITRTAVNKHLAILRDNEWVTMRPDYTRRLYRLDDGAMKQLTREVNRLRAMWRHHPSESALPEVPAASRHPRPKTGAAKGMRGHRREAWRP